MTARDLAKIVKILKALADPTRLQMVQTIAAAGELDCGQVTEGFALAQPTISHHLKVLADAGILVARTEGQHRFHSLDRAVLEAFLTILPSLFAPGSPVAAAR